MLNRIDLSRVDLNLLVLFDSVREAGHVGRAAGELHLTSSAVSHGLGRLRRLLNDPLFIRTPKGVVPTERALQLAGPIADLLARTRSVLASAEPFDPRQARRRFTVGAPDGISAVLLPGLLAALQVEAPGVDIGIRQLLPAPAEMTPERAWQSAFADLEDRTVDLAVLPYGEVPARFHAAAVYEEDFVVAIAAGHPVARKLTLSRYCDMRHLVVSQSGDPHGFVDEVLAAQGHTRRVALTVPNFMFALSVVAATDLACAMPRRFAALHGARFGIVALEPPLPLARFQLHAVTPKAALMDAGLAWLLDLLVRCAPAARPRGRGEKTITRTTRGITPG